MGIQTASFAPDGTRLLTGSSGGYLKEWDTSTGEPTTLLDPEGVDDVERGGCVNALPFDLTRSLQYSPDGRLLAAGGDEGLVGLWEFASGTRVFEEHGHSRPVGTVTFSADGRRLASGAWDGGVKVWDVASGTCLAECSYDGIVVACLLNADGTALDVAEKPEGSSRARMHRLEV